MRSKVRTEFESQVHCFTVRIQYYSKLSRVRLFETPWTVVYQASLSMGFSRQEYWSGLPFSSPRDLPNPGIELTSLASPALAGGFFYQEHHLGSPVAFCTYCQLI